MNTKIWLHTGADYAHMAQDVCEAAALAEHIGSREARIGIKPNLVNATPASRGATTHVEVVEGIIAYLQAEGFGNIIILEGAWVGDHTAAAFECGGYTQLSKRLHVPLVDTQKDTYRDCNAEGMKLSICDSAMALDFLINVPVMKGHCQTKITCALKNMKGVIPNAEKRRFHTMGLHKPIAHLSSAVQQGFVLVDAICGDLDFEEGGTPVERNQIFGTYDPVLCDAYVCSQLGYAVQEVPYIGMAEALGVGCSDLTQASLIQLGQQTPCLQQASRRVAALTGRVAAQDACSACYANLVYALERLNGEGLLTRLPEIAIGQGFRGQAGDCGIGSCTAGFSKYAKGCPPTSVDILALLRDIALNA